MLTAKDKQFGHEVTAGRAGYACEKCAKCKKENEQGSTVWTSFLGVYCSDCVEEQYYKNDCDCQGCYTCGECSVCKPWTGCPDCNDKFTW